MGDTPHVADPAALGKVKVNVQAEFWIDPLDHVPLAERRAMACAGSQPASARGFPSCEVDAALKRVTPQILLEIFMGELACATKPSNIHGHWEQKVAGSSSQYCLKDEEYLREKNSTDTFANRRAVEIHKNVPAVSVELVQMSSHMAANLEDRSPFKDCRSQVSEPNVCQCSFEVTCFGLKGCSSGQKDAGVGYDDMVLSSPDQMIKVKVEPFDSSVHTNAGIAHVGKTNRTAVAEREHVDHISPCNRCMLSHISSIAGEYSQLDESLEPDDCCSSLDESRNGTTTQGRTSICYSGTEYKQDISAHTEECAAEKLSAENNNVDRELPSVAYVAESSEVNAVTHTYTSADDTPESPIAFSPSAGVRLSSMDVYNQCDASLEASNPQRSQGGNSNSDRAFSAESMECVSGLQEQSSLIANKRHSDSTMSTDPGRTKYKFSVHNCLSKESAAKCTRNSVSYPESCTPKKVGEVLSNACIHSFSSGANNVLEREVQSSTLGQKETHIKADLLCGSSLSSSIATVKAELADDDAYTHLSETRALKESCLFHSSSNTRSPLQAFNSQDNNPFIIHNLQKNREVGDICLQGTLTNHLRTPLVTERERSFGTKSDPCVSVLSFAHARVKFEATEFHNNQVLEADGGNNLCGSISSSQMDSAISSKGEMPKQSCDSQAPEGNNANDICTSVFDTHENSVPMNPYTVSANDLSFSPRRVRVETQKEINVVDSSETATATNLSVRSSDSSNLFEGDICQDNLSTVCEMQTIQEGETMCSNKTSSNVPAGSNLRGLPPNSVVPTIKTANENHPGYVSETEGAANFTCFASESSDKAVGKNECTGMLLGETYCNTAALAPDSALKCPMSVKEEPLEEVHVDSISETKTKKDSSLSFFRSPDNFYMLSPLPNIRSSSKTINRQSVSPGVCTGQHNQEKAVTGSAQVSISEDDGIITCQKQYCTANQGIDSDIRSLKEIENVEQLVERCANIYSGNAAGISNCPYSSNTLALKSEPVEGSIRNLCNYPLGDFSSCDLLLVEAKTEIVSELSVDALDHMPLAERIKILSSRSASELNPTRKSRYSKRAQVHAVDCDPVNSLKVKVKSLHQRKRKKTATDSVEVALEEDAPGLLLGLLDRGINPDEIKLYGCEEDVDALDISSNEDSFEDLEAVISKLFSEQPTSLFMLAPLRPAKGKAVYCLACLISLIEQTRYLRFRSRPVEWGWCRDLHSFIFVFEMHNRIVLERPEYGYATYFFELVESVPIGWQIQRLVTAMKLTSCSRATLIENKPLLVGVDLSDGEARVLEEYGWQPNTGLGSMLNYCDRVVHVRGNEQDTSDWRLKIGKLLMEGYDGGRVVKANLPKKVVDYVGSHCLEIKMETI